MNVLSLFDGMSCGQQALQRGGHTVSNYFASEIDKYAITITQKNFPSTIQLGSVVDVNVDSLPKIDLLIGGSPCQSFSFAGKRKGMSTKCEQKILTLEKYLELKSEGFEFEGQSYLFWEYMRILTDIKKKNPKVKFLLENVMMGEMWEKILTKAIGVNPIEINSALVSAQNRRRLYWTNIGMQPSGLFGDLESIIKQPKDKVILLKDILHRSKIEEKFYLSEKMISYLNSRAGKYTDFKIDPDKTGAMNTKNNSCNLSTDSETKYITEERVKNPKANFNNGKINYKSGKDKASCITASSGQMVDISDNIIVDEKYYLSEKAIEYCERNKQNLGFRMNEEDEKSMCITAVFAKQIPYNQIQMNARIRRLTPIECERLQTVADNYTEGVSDSQRYKMLGNGWTIDVIVHILSYLKY